nr:MAG TPA: hypothetical protein [Microviridae sp.]
MAKRKLVAQLNPVDCKVVDSLELVTKPNLAMTPKQVQELTDRGIAVSLPNEKSFLDGSSSKTDWSIDPIFRRDADMCSMWELSRDCQGRILKAQKADKKAHPVKG